MNSIVGRSSLGHLLAVMCVIFLCAGQSLAYEQGDPEFRAFWVDCVTGHPGLFTQAEIDKLLGVPGNPNSLGDIREANCNAVIAEVRRAGKCMYDSALDEPWATAGNFDALAAVLRAAHDTTGGKKRIEVHAWIVTFMTGGGQIWDAHRDLNNPDNYWPTLTDTGATADSAWDPGHPKVQKYIVDVMMDLATNYDVDGVHYDYIRYTGGNQGYNPTSIARYNTRYGTSGNPSPTDDRFDQWRRDQISGIVRQVYARIQAVKPNVLQSGSFVTWNPSPSASTRTAFQSTRPYGNRTDGVFSDWDAWMEEGIMDFGVPMNYYDERELPADYDRWLNFIKDRKFNRHMVNGPGLYKNWLSNNDVINQILATRDPSPAGNTCAGFCGFSYWAPYVINKPTGYGNWDTFEPALLNQVTQTWADIPNRPWKSNPTKGHISGTITYASDGTWADHAIVSISGPESRSMYVDGTGFYAFIDLTPGVYTITASKPGYANVVGTATVAIGVVTGNMYVVDLELGGITELVISNVGSSSVTNNSATITWDTNLGATSQVQYGVTTSYGQTTVLDTNEVVSHVQTLAGLTPKTTYHYRVVSTRDGITKYSSDGTFSTEGPPAISNVQVASVSTNSATITWDTDMTSNSTVNYGTSASYGSSASDPALVTSHSVVINGLAANTTYHYQCSSTNTYGTATSGDFVFTTPLYEVVVDNTDPGWASTGTGAWSAGSAAGVPRIGSNYLFYAGQTSPTRKCTWTPDLDVAGYYDVYAYYQKGTNRNTAAPYTTYYNGGQVTSVQNQNATEPNQGGWFLVAESKPFLAGTAGKLELTNQSTDTKYVSADAAKWVYKGPLDTTPPAINSVVVTPAMAAIGDLVHVTVDATDASGVATLTANSTVSLTKSTGNTWTGDVIALGPRQLHSVSITATDTHGNFATNTSASYRTAQVLAASCQAAWRPLTVGAAGLYLFKFWGKVTEIDADRFTINDGSGSVVTIHAPGYKAKIANNDYATVRGILNVAGGIESEPAVITKY